MLYYRTYFERNVKNLDKDLLNQLYIKTRDILHQLENSGEITRDSSELRLFYQVLCMLPNSQHIPNKVIEKYVRQYVDENDSTPPIEDIERKELQKHFHTHLVPISHQEHDAVVKTLIRNTRTGKTYFDDENETWVALYNNPWSKKQESYNLDMQNIRKVDGQSGRYYIQSLPNTPQSQSLLFEINVTTQMIEPNFRSGLNMFYLNEDENIALEYFTHIQDAHTEDKTLDVDLLNQILTRQDGSIDYSAILRQNLYEFWNILKNYTDSFEIPRRIYAITSKKYFTPTNQVLKEMRVGSKFKNEGFIVGSEALYSERINHQLGYDHEKTGTIFVLETDQSVPIETTTHGGTGLTEYVIAPDNEWVVTELMKIGPIQYIFMRQSDLRYRD